jgi:protein-S-isoprenylcysteine O-methyltransferase Ste14
MSRLAMRCFAVTAYAAFVVVYTYFTGFVSGIGVPATVDRGPVATPLEAVAIDTALVLFFGLAHSVMARATFKQVWTRIVPSAVERSAYVLVASAQLALLCWQWRPIAEPMLWRATGVAALVLQVVGQLGWLIALVSSFLVDHFELFGLKQAFGRSAPATRALLRTPFLYRWVRHPLYLGMLVGLWAAPAMNVGHLLLAVLLTLYVLIGVHHEERDLLRVFGDQYRRYQERVPMLFPIPRRAGGVASSSRPVESASTR